MEVLTEYMQRLLPAVLLGAINGLFLWTLWSLRKLFVRHDTCRKYRQNMTMLELRFTEHLNTFERSMQSINNLPKTQCLHEVREELAKLHNKHESMVADIQDLHATLKRVEQPLAMLLQHHVKM